MNCEKCNSILFLDPDELSVFCIHGHRFYFPVPFEDMAAIKTACRAMNSYTQSDTMKFKDMTSEERTAYNREYARQYHQRNRERILERKRAYAARKRAERLQVAA